MRVGIIGTGWGCSVQVPFFQQAGLEVVALYSRDLSRARALCEELDIDPSSGAFDSVEALVTAPHVDLISVVSPTFLHAAHAQAALRAGKHVLCDKPLAVTAAEAAPLVASAAAAAAQGVARPIALVDHELRFLRCVQAAARWVRGGAIGELRHVSASFLVNMRGLGMRHHTWWHERARGGGISAALGVHVVDLLSFVTGRRLVSLSGRASTFVHERPGGVATADDAFSIEGTLGAAVAGDSGAPSAAPGAAAGSGTVAVASVVVNGLAALPEAERRLVVLGSNGSVVLDLVACVATRFDRKGREAEDGGEAAVVAEEDEEKGWEMAAPDAFVHGTFALAAALAASGGDAAHSALDAGCTLEEGVYVAAVMDAMRASSDAGGARRAVPGMVGAAAPSSRL